MNGAELALLLPTVPLRDSFSVASADKLAALCKPEEIAEGSVLFEEGSANPWLYVIVEGRVGLEMCVTARGCTRILTLERGDLLAWSAILGDGRMTATAIALLPTKVLKASAADLSALCEADHDFGYEWMRAMAIALSKRLAATRLQLLDLYGDMR
jgi:CRP-like cAMP-binding protein